MAQFSESGDGVERRRLGLFLLLAFGIAWATASVLYATGGFRDSPRVFESGPLSLSLASVLLPTAFMFAPGIANALTRVLTGEGWDDLLLSPTFFEHWHRYIAGWFVPGLLTALGAALFFVLFPRYFDPTARAFAEQVGAGGEIGTSPLVLAAVTVGAAFVINPLFNTLFAFSEEFGWRGTCYPNSPRWASDEPSSSTASSGESGTGHSSRWGTSTGSATSAFPGPGSRSFSVLPSPRAPFSRGSPSRRPACGPPRSPTAL